MRHDVKNLFLIILGSVFLVFCLAPVALPQENTGKLTLRSMQVDWYMSSSVGVKLQYRDFSNDPHVLYLPKQFERKLYRFVEAPKNYANMAGLPMLLVHMRNQEILFVDIYTEYLRKKALIAKYSEEDLGNFKASEQKGKIEIQFQ